MPTEKGRSDVRRFITGLPAEIEAKLLLRAARAGANVLADEARDRVTSDAVREGLVVGRAKREGDRIVIKISVKAGWARSLGNWLEWGTDPHYISVTGDQRAGRSIGRINRLLGDAKGDKSLVINGHAVGKTVFHTGAQAHPFLRVALDLKEAEAIAAARAAIAGGITRGGITGTAEPDEGADV